jgi:hypothetical protein
MSQRSMLARPFATSSTLSTLDLELDQFGGLPARVNSPAMSLSASDSSRFSSEESDFSGFGSSQGGVRSVGNLMMPDHLEYAHVCMSSSHSSHTHYLHSQGAMSVNSSTSSLGMSQPSKFSRVCDGYHANLTGINMPPTRALPTILKLHTAIISFEILRF